MSKNGKDGSTGTGSRYDRFTPNYINISKRDMPGMGHWNGALTKIFCAKCQSDKPRDGHKKRGQMVICADCHGKQTSHA